jgi:hypothetical protein
VPAREPDRLALGVFAGAVVIGGSNFVAVRFSNRELDPLWGAFLRFALAAAVFVVLVAVLRLPLPRRRVLGPAAVYGLLAFGGTYGCLYWALQDVPAGIGAVVMAVGPLLTLLLAVGHRLEHLTVRALAGSLIGARRDDADLLPVRHGRVPLAVVCAPDRSRPLRVRVGDRVQADRAAAPGGDERRRDDSRLGRAAARRDSGRGVVRAARRR